jgi:hypothetical protein
VNALDVLQALLDAVTQSGPHPRDFDIDYEALGIVLLDARIALYKAGRLIP